MADFQTIVNVEPLGFEVSYRSHGFCVGSCFAENLASLLRRARLPIVSNPFGTMFNPASVASCITRLAAPKPYTEQDIVQSEVGCYSFFHHSSLGAPTAAQTLERMNTAQKQGAEALAKADYVVITLGTSWVYERAGEVVANCHKHPSGEFERRPLTTTQVEQLLEPLCQGVLADKHIVLTVSPVRHIKDGLAENSLSKSTLIVACHNIVARNANTSYFPSYEIVVDELRDYRFYDRDMVHPSALAVEIVVDRFCRATMQSATLSSKAEMERLVATLEHRPYDPNGERHKELMAKTMAHIAKLEAKMKS